MHFLPARQVCGDHPISLQRCCRCRSIKGNPNNAREHNRKQLAKLTRSIKKFSFITPIVVDETGDECWRPHTRFGGPTTQNSNDPCCPRQPFERVAETTLSSSWPTIGSAQLASWNAKSLKREAAVPKRTGHRLRFSRTRLRNRGNRLYPRG